MVEIRAAEGGNDAKDLVREQLAIYASYCRLHGLTAEIIDDRAGTIVVEVAGKGAAKLFAGESGGHRWQHVPRSEKKGRVHTSTVTVAVMSVLQPQVDAISERDIEWQAIRGSGNGGQARQKTSNAVQMKHLPTGVAVRVESSRSQLANRESAFRLLAARIAGAHQNAQKVAQDGARRALVGTGERGDKIRTVRVRDNHVTDHQTGKKISLTRYRRGHVDELHYQ